MMLTPKDVIDLVQNKAPQLSHNHKLIDVFGGSLTPYIVQDLEAQLSPQSFEQQMHRLSPINLLPKIIDKLTNIYQTAVTRQAVDGSETDAELLSWYVDSYAANDYMNTSNELLNLCKTSLIYPYVSRGMPKLRVILNDRFVVYSNDPIDPNIPTHVIVLGDKVDGKDIFWTWSADAFQISDSDGRARPDLMKAFNNDGSNPIGRLPFVYVNESKHALTPCPDSDLLRMIKLIPIMCSDLNMAAMFQCFSILWTIDLNDTNLKFAPNAVWALKSDPTSDKKPEIGSIKPQVDYDQVLGLIQSQLTIWLSTKGIRAGSVGTLTTDNFASGISKLIDEMDTYEARQKQTGIYLKAEAELWDLTMNYMHPYWADSGQIDNPARWTPTASVATKFTVQLPAQSRGVAVRDLRDEYAAGFISRRGALAKLNPEMSDAELDALMVEIDAERTIKADDNGESDAVTA